MKILVTGGTGGVGTVVTARLAQNGHQVRVADRNLAEQPHAGVEYCQCDVTDFEQVCAAMSGMEGVVHLAAYPNPALASGPETFRVNTLGTYTVFEAAAKEGIRRVAQASSINAFGNGYGVHDVPLRYFPIDEDHPTSTSDPYSFSKETAESIAAYYWRREGISSTSLRMPFVVTFNEHFMRMSKGVGMFRQALVDLLAAPPERQREWVGKIRAWNARMRAERMGEKPWTGGPPRDFDPELMAGFGVNDFWAILAAEDAAQAFEKSLLAEFEGSHPLFISQAENSNGAESEALLRAFYPEVTQRKRAIPGANSILSYDRARELIGYEPQVLIRERLAA